MTIEVNPGTVTVELLDTWKKAGINRLSIGVQSLKDTMLKSLNRHQTCDDVRTVLQQASERFDNLSVDFIIGMPGVLDEEWKEMMQQAVRWPIKHISIYFLTVHEDTPLYFKVNSKKIQLPADDAMVDLYHWTVAFLQEHGFNRYEISNFAQKGHESVDNAAYWNRKPYRGFGLGACSFTGTTRFANTKNLGKYLQSLQTSDSIVEMSEVLTEKQIMLERLMLGLRQSKGICVADYVASLSDAGQQHFYTNLEMVQKAQLVDFQKGIVRLTPQGYALENEVTLRLFSEN